MREVTLDQNLKPTRKNLHRIQKDYTDKYGRDFFAQQTVKKVLNKWSVGSDFNTSENRFFHPAARRRNSGTGPEFSENS